MKWQGRLSEPDAESDTEAVIARKALKRWQDCVLDGSLKLTDKYWS